jgi:hypothetical protein
VGSVSFEVASAYDEPELAVSTQIYLKNKHLDNDKDGVVCFFENESKPGVYPMALGRNRLLASRFISKTLYIDGDIKVGNTEKAHYFSLHSNLC